ncbi:MAG: hypothetical protein HY516_04610 [Candidatus Aenigmarchaeota archaeon]|nr:hypothetical protein [Candidatus Aenigmarchaeota archaeon]
MTQCPNCQNSVHLVQSTPTVILLCKGCGTFFDASLQVVGDLKAGLDMDRISNSPKTVERPRQEQPAEPQISEQEPATDIEEQKPEQPVRRTESMASFLSGSGFSSGYGCPKCGSGMKPMESPVTGNILYTCAKCGYTGTVYVKR